MNLTIVGYARELGKSILTYPSATTNEQVRIFELIFDKYREGKTIGLAKRTGSKNVKR